MIELTGSVGKGGLNKQPDVAGVQAALIRHSRWLLGGGVPSVSGTFDPATGQAIVAFQASACALLHPDEIVSPRGFTLQQLNRAIIPFPQSKVFSQVCWNHQADALTPADYAAAATTLGCESAAIQAVAQTETKKSAWDGLGRPTILYERHYFGRLSKHVYDQTHPDISSRKPYQRTAEGVSPDNTYGPLAQQYKRLFRAAVLDETAALQSASWGAFQIMGANYAACGFAGVGDFIDAMLASEKRQLDAFVSLINNTPALKSLLQRLDWTGFAKIYNGTDNGKVVDGYDTRIADAYAAIKK